MKIILMMLLCCFVLVGCGGSSKDGIEEVTKEGGEFENETQKESEELEFNDEQEKDKNNEKKDLKFPYGEDIGNGTMHLSTAGGTTEDGNIPDVLASKDTILMQIGINTVEFDSSHFSFIYIDGIYREKCQLGDSQYTIDLLEDFLKEGEHTVSVVQYEANEENGEIVTYKEAKYKIVY